MGNQGNPGGYEGPEPGFPPREHLHTPRSSPRAGGGASNAVASRFYHWRTGSPKHPKPSLRAKRSNPFFCAARWIASSLRSSQWR